MAKKKNESDVFEQLNKVLSGRGPFVYAFKTQDVPESLKIGYTSRLVGSRLYEWKKTYGDLEEVCRDTARVDDNRAFMDTEIHKFLENMPASYKARRASKKTISRLAIDERKKIYSKEFFRNATEQDFKCAVQDIRDAEAGKNNRSYHFINLNQTKPDTDEIVRDQNYKLRKEQSAVVEKFKEIYEKAKEECDSDKGKKKKKNVYRKLLLYAVMRFGKTFTSLECAREVGAKLVVVVSAKKDVEDEWRRQVLAHENYKNFVFLDQKDLCDKESSCNNRAIQTFIEEGKTVVVSLTLQRLASKSRNSQDVLKELKSQQIDLLIVDETHFGARGEIYGKALKEDDSDEQNSKNADYLDKKYCKTIKDAEEKISPLKSIVQLHLSGTPYRILISNEFADEDIIGYFSSAELQQKQNDSSEDLEKKGKPEWENPYFGFPQLVRFAFDFDEFVNCALRKKADNDISYSISEMLEPQSINDDYKNSSHKKFKHEKQVLELLNIIDGSSKGLDTLGFLNYEKIKSGCMCRHMVWTLPYKASCDAMEALLKKERNKFKNLRDYNIVNVGGLNSSFDSSSAIAEISKYEGRNEKTITLTVDMMLAGVTVKEWDTILFMKGTQSPQEYDQAVFRVQNPYIVEDVLDDGTNVKIDKKPQTLLVDFDMNRMFQMQEKRSWFATYDNKDQFTHCVESEVNNSPIFILNTKNIKRFEANDVLNELKKYAQKRSLIDEAKDITPDQSLLNNRDFRLMIESLNSLNSKNPFLMSKNEDGAGKENKVPKDVSASGGESAASENATVLRVLIEKMRTFYAKILFYAFITDDNVESLDDIIKGIRKPSNSPIASALRLNTKDLKVLSGGHKGNILDLDKRIYAINQKKKAKSLETINIVLGDFSRLSGSEIVTPKVLAKQIAELLPSSCKNGNDIIVDVGSRTAEIACALSERFGIEKMQDRIHSFCSSPLAYEITKKMYSLLGLNVNNVHQSALNMDSLNAFIAEIKNLNPTAIVGSPSFVVEDEDKPIYHRVFQEIRDKINPNIIIMMMKAVWYSGGRGLDKFRKEFLEEKRIPVMHDYPDPQEIGMSSSLRGGLCIFKWQRDYQGDCEFHCHIRNDYDDCVSRPLMTNLDRESGNCNILLRFNQGIRILRKVLKKSKEKGYVSYDNYVSSRDPFKLGDKFKDYKQNQSKRYSVLLYLTIDKKSKKNKIGFVAANKILEGPIKKWKVIVAKASPGADALPHGVISAPIVSKPNSVCTNSHLLVRICSSEREAKNLKCYMQTKFFRFMMIMAKNGHNLTNQTYQFVPDVGLNTIWTDEKLYKHFGITDKRDKDYIAKLVQEKFDS